MQRPSCRHLLFAHINLIWIAGMLHVLAASTSAVDKSLASNDATEVDRAITDIRAMLVGPPRFAAIENLNARWLRTLITLKRHDEAAELALAGG